MMNRRLKLGLVVALCLSIGACTTDDGMTIDGTASAQSVPVVGDAIHGANLTQQTVAGIPGAVLESVTSPEAAASTAGVVEVRDTREKIEDRRVNRRTDQGLPMTAEDRIRLRKEERRAPQSTAPGNPR